MFILEEIIFNCPYLAQWLLIPSWDVLILKRHISSHLKESLVRTWQACQKGWRMSVRACGCGFVDYASGVTLQTTLLCYNKLHTRWTQSDINVFLIWYLGMRPTSLYVHIKTQVGRKPKICVGPFVDLNRIAWVTCKFAQSILVFTAFNPSFGRFLSLGQK